MFTSFAIRFTKQYTHLSSLTSRCCNTLSRYPNALHFSPSAKF